MNTRKERSKLHLSELEPHEQEESRQNHKEEVKGSNLADTLVTVSDPTGLVSEAYRTLRTNLMYSLVDAVSEVIVITSPAPAEGKSTTCANLGVLLAQVGKSTLIIDCDFRKPTQHKLFKLRNLYGVTNILVGERGLQEAWQEPLQGLKVITVGQIPPNPAELVASRHFTKLVEQVREQFDYVLLDAPPTELVSDPVILATQADGVLLVLDSQNSRKGSLKRAVRSMDAVGARVLGTVLNYIEVPKGGNYYHYYGLYGSNV